MSKKDVQKKYFPVPTDEQIAAAEAKIRAVKRAARKPKKLKIDRVIETVVRCISLGKSSRLTSEIVMREHKYKISKDSILRFAKTLPTATSA